MANSREAQSQWNVTKAMFFGGREYVSWLELPNYRLIKLEEERLFLEVAWEGYGLTSVNDARSGKPQDSEKLDFANGIADLIERDEAVMTQLRNHSEDQVMHGLFPKKAIDAVLDALSDHEKLRVPLLEDEETGRQFALVILKLLAGRSSNDLRAV